MFSERAWGGGTEPFILTKFLPYDPPEDQPQLEDPVVSFIVFEWRDEKYIGADTEQVRGHSVSHHSIMIADNTLPEGEHLRPSRDRL